MGVPRCDVGADASRAPPSRMKALKRMRVVQASGYLCGNLVSTGLTRIHMALGLGPQREDLGTIEVAKIRVVQSLGSP